MNGARWLLAWCLVVAVSAFAEAPLDDIQCETAEQRSACVGSFARSLKARLTILGFDDQELQSLAAALDLPVTGSVDSAYLDLLDRQARHRAAERQRDADADAGLFTCPLLADAGSMIRVGLSGGSKLCLEGPQLRIRPSVSSWVRLSGVSLRLQSGDAGVVALSGGRLEVDQLTSCWTDGLLKVSEGSRVWLYCPASRMYGDWGAPQIPPGAATIFSFRLEEVLDGGVGLSVVNGVPDALGSHFCNPACVGQLKQDIARLRVKYGLSADEVSRVQQLLPTLKKDELTDAAREFIRVEALAAAARASEYLRRNSAGLNVVRQRALPDFLADGSVMPPAPVLKKWIAGQRVLRWVENAGGANLVDPKAPLKVRFWAGDPEVLVPSSGRTPAKQSARTEFFGGTGWPQSVIPCWREGLKGVGYGAELALICNAEGGYGLATGTELDAGVGQWWGFWIEIPSD